MLQSHICTWTNVTEEMYIFEMLRILACARILLRDGRIEMIVIYVNKT